MVKYYSVLILLCIVPLLLLGQKRTTLEKKRKSIQKNIKATTAAIKATQKNKKATLQKYLLLKEQAKSRAEFVQNLQDDLSTLEYSLERNQDIVFSLKTDLDKAKKDYVNFVKKAYRQQYSNQRLLFLFSATNFNEAVRRWQYLKQYHKFRKNQARYIVNTEQSIASKVDTLILQTREKQDLLAMATNQKVELEKAVASKNKLLKKLSSKEKVLQKDLQRQQKSKDGLNDAIENAIRSQNRNFVRRSKTKEGLKGIPRKLNKSEKILATNFRKMQGRLALPAKGKVVGRFGIQRHPTFKQVKIKNDGIDIRTPKNALARSVYQGKVVSVVFVPGNENAIMIQHGDYYTVYSRISKALVKKGNIVKKGQAIGRVGTKKGKPELHFQIWKDDVRLNPEKWVRK